MTFQIRAGELLQACYLPGVSEGWALTIRLERFSVHRGWLSQVEEEPAFLLAKEGILQLSCLLDRLDSDYRPQHGPSGPDYKFLTYLANSESRHITWIDGWSPDFDGVVDFNAVWSVLEELAFRLKS